MTPKQLALLIVIARGVASSSGSSTINALIARIISDVIEEAEANSDQPPNDYFEMISETLDLLRTHK